MNSTKLFNFGYLIENIKKSKAIMIIAMLVVPFFTILQLVNTKEQIYSLDSLSIVNAIFLYIVPFVLSASLYGYVFKKTSVDFVASKPISKKSLFITNFIGGVAIILLIQLATFLSTYLILTFTNDCIYFPIMSWDIFIYYTIGYVFMFTVSSLAMAVSGNIMTQIATTLLIAFLSVASYVFIAAETMVIDRWPDLYTFTAPIYVWAKIENMFWPSIIKMLVLTIVYFILGIMLFKKRKMEMAGESFVKENTHIIVKILTLVPFSFCVIDFNETKTTCILLGIMLIYWFVYDLITNKKIKFLKNLLWFILGTIAVIGVYSLALIGVEKYTENKMLTRYDDIMYDEIEKIEAKEVRYYNEKLYYAFKVDLVITKEELKELRYADLNNAFRSDAWMVGMVTMEDGKTGSETVNVDAEKLEQYIQKNNVYEVSLNDCKVAVLGLSKKQNEDIINMLKSEKITEISNTKYRARFLKEYNEKNTKLLDISAIKYENNAVKKYIYEIPIDGELATYLKDNNLIRKNEYDYYDKAIDEDFSVYDTKEVLEEGGNNK